MSKKQQRIKMLVQLDNSLADISNYSQNQCAKNIKINMQILRDHVKNILKLDGISALTNKGKE